MRGWRAVTAFAITAAAASGGMVEAVCAAEFLAIVAAIVGDENAQRYAAILLTAAHGAAGLQMSGLLTTDKWQTSAEELIDTVIAMATETEHPN